MESNHNTVIGRRTVFMGLLACLVVIFLAAPTTLAKVSDEDCTSCHDEVGESYSMTAHGVYLTALEVDGYNCESCHGPGDAHVEEGDPSKIINPAKAGTFTDEETCMTCHTGHQFDDWAFSSHRNGDVTCADCHKVHVSAEKGSKSSCNETCYGCHSDVRAASYMPSHHPIAEGKINCVDCHNVHGGQVKLAMDDSGNELCYSCHADKEGPFVYEHAPVVEDCKICHSPHGTVADNLLKLNEPALCLNCHSMHFHATVEGVDGAFDNPQAPERSGISTPDSFKESMLTKCTRCHTGIHGSDHPSQTISTGGNALTR